MNEVMEHGNFAMLVEDSNRRRLWLLFKALECGPLDQALELARRCDDFVTGEIAEPRLAIAPSCPQPSVAALLPVEEVQTATSAVSSVGLEETPPPKPTRLTLTAQQRDRLLERLSEGAKNAELAAELGLSSKQVQGIRMGCARQIANRRAQRESQQSPSLPPALNASVDEVVRYLRQQDDVVVPQDGGEFLVNARFRLRLAELVSRANRMRARQGKPEFELQAGTQAPKETVNSANGHPLFWGETTSG